MAARAKLPASRSTAVPTSKVPAFGHATFGVMKSLGFVAALFLFAAVASAQSTRPGMGSIPFADQNGTGVTFRVWAPFATNVVVRGEFNAWGETPLVSEANGN